MRETIEVGYQTFLSDGEPAFGAVREVLGRADPGAALADLLDVEPQPLDAEHGVEQVQRVAVIREDECIGCTKCIQACPVDAILGAAKHMHTVIESECTGCDLCVEPCPVDCIDMLPVKTDVKYWAWDMPRPAHGGHIIASDRSPDRGRAA